MKRSAPAAILALLMLLIVMVSAVQAQDAIVAEVPAAEYSFGQHITFHLSATAPSPITHVSLNIRVEGQPGVSVVTVPFEPEPAVTVQQAYNPGLEGVPPFSTVTYWWEIRDAQGNQRQTEPQSLYYADNRYSWQSTTGGYEETLLKVFWVQGDAAFGRAVLDVAIAALDEIQRELRAGVPGFVHIFVYPGEMDLRNALNLSGYDWAGGQARPELGAILVGIPDDPAARGEMERLIPHELTHLLVYEAAGRSLGRVPPWLDEGLASLHELRPDPSREALVNQALEEEQLFPLETLCAPFPTDGIIARLAYAQSASVVSYLRERHGGQVIRDLLAAYRDGVTCEGGVTRVLRKSLNGLDVDWRGSLTDQGAVYVALKESGLWLALWFLSALLVLPLVGVLRTRNKRDTFRGGGWGE